MSDPGLPRRIHELSRSLGLRDDDVEPFGWYAGKLSPRAWQEGEASGRLIVVTAITPTALGEGKTVTTIGLGQALARLGKRAIVTLREPSLAPVFGIKGGGAGAGRACLVPKQVVNLGLTGDLPAVAAAHNLLSALIDNHVYRRHAPELDPTTVAWKRVMDVSDRSLARIITGVGGPGALRESGFELTAASEIMAILALCRDREDLSSRLSRILVGFDFEQRPVSCSDLGVAGAMAALLQNALRPNLVQTCEGTPALVHTGPFGNIAPGNSSVIADLAGARLADYVITEAGFATDAGAEKHFHIKCPQSGLVPRAVVLVCTLRALKAHSGRFDVRPGRLPPAALGEPDMDALREGAENLRAHLAILGRFGVPAVVAINRFASDDPAELALVRDLARDMGAVAALESDVFERGSAGGEALAEAVVAAAEIPTTFRPLFPADAPVLEKLDVLARDVYGARGVELSPRAERSLQRWTELGFGHLPVCVAKSQYSLSHDPELGPHPSDYTFPIRELLVSAGAGFLYALAGDIRTMPGLPADPAAKHIDVDAEGRIVGLR